MSRRRDFTALATSLRDELERQLAKLKVGPVRGHLQVMRDEVNQFLRDLPKRQEEQDRLRQGSKPLERAYKLYRWGYDNCPKHTTKKGRNLTLQNLHAFLVAEQDKRRSMEFFREPLPDFDAFVKQVNRVLKAKGFQSHIWFQQTRPR